MLEQHFQKKITSLGGTKREQIADVIDQDRSNVKTNDKYFWSSSDLTRLGQAVSISVSQVVVYFIVNKKLQNLEEPPLVI